MTDDDEDDFNKHIRKEADKFLVAALQGLENAPRLIARELRQMADGAPPYKCFTYTSPRIKNVWRAAADLLDGGAG